MMENKKEIRIVFDGPPSHESGRFVEVENEKGEGIRFGEWRQEGDFWYLCFPDHLAALAEKDAALKAEQKRCEVLLSVAQKKEGAESKVRELVIENRNLQAALKDMEQRYYDASAVCEEIGEERDRLQAALVEFLEAQGIGRKG